MNQLKTPWREAGYKGKLKPTVLLPNQKGFIEPTRDEKIEILYNALADAEIDIDQFNKFILRI